MSDAKRRMTLRTLFAGSSVGWLPAGSTRGPIVWPVTDERFAAAAMHPAATPACFRKSRRVGCLDGLDMGRYCTHVQGPDGHEDTKKHEEHKNKTLFVVRDLRAFVSVLSNHGHSGAPSKP